MTDRSRGGAGWGVGRLSERNGYVMYNQLLTYYLELAPSSAHPRIFFFFFVAVFFVFWILIEYIVCSVLAEHVQRFEPHVDFSQRTSAL